MTARSAAHVPSIKPTFVTSAFALAALASVRAAAADSTQDARAQTLFEAAKQLQSGGQIADACPMFAESNRLAPGVGVKLHLADCYEHLGRTASAWSQFRAAERFARARGDLRRADLAHARAQALEANLDRLTVTTGTGPREGWQVAIDGIALPPERWNRALAVDPGDHVVVIQAPGQAPLTRNVHLDASHPTALISTDDGASSPSATASAIVGPAADAASTALTVATPAVSVPEGATPIATPAAGPIGNAPAAPSAATPPTARPVVASAPVAPAPAALAPAASAPIPSAAAAAAAAAPATGHASASTPSPASGPVEPSVHDTSTAAAGLPGHDGSGTRLGIAIGLAGLGALGAGFGTFFLIRRSVFISHDCPCDTSLENEASTGATISFGVAGAAAASSIVLLLTGPSQKSQVGWTFGPAPIEGGAGAIVRTSF